MSTETPQLGDSRLAQRAAGGSNRAFEAIFERYHQDLYRYCAAIVGNAADAQDAVQSTMVKVLQALPGEQRRIELKPWLYRIAHNEAIEIVRRRAPAEEIDADSLLGPTSAADEAIARERLQRLVADVAELPERQRGALVMRELSGLGFEEIGAALGTSAATARQTLYEARLGLRRMSEGREMDCAEAWRAISDGDRRVLRGRRLRAHLRACESCRAFPAEIEQRGAELALLAPLPAAAAAGLLQAVLGGSGAAGAAGAGGAAAAGGGASVAGTTGAAAGKSLLTATALKAAAAVGAVVAIGVTAADQRGLIHLGSSHRESPPPARSAPPVPGAAAAAGSSSPPGGAARASANVARRAAGAAGRRALAPARAAAEPAAARELAPRHRKQRSPAAVPAAAAPAHTDNGKHLGQVKHPGHGTGNGNGVDSSARSHGRSGSAPGHTKASADHAKPKAKAPKPRHHEALAKSPPGQAKKSPAATPAAPAPESAQPEHPSAPGKPASAPGAPAEAHGKAAAEAPVAE
jgi:RNA polymerase sigma factor (sigma-70 family)